MRLLSLSLLLSLPLTLSKEKWKKKGIHIQLKTFVFPSTKFAVQLELFFQGKLLAVAARASLLLQPYSPPLQNSTNFPLEPQPPGYPRLASLHPFLFISEDLSKAFLLPPFHLFAFRQRQKCIRYYNMPRSGPRVRSVGSQIIPSDRVTLQPGLPDAG